MTAESQRRRLMRHGFVFLVLALLLGLAIVALPNPRRWMAAHMTALITAVILASIGLAWRDLRLSPGQRTVTFWCGLVSAYAGLAANVFGALVDLPGPASNPGVQPPMPQAAVFFSLLAIIVPTLFTSFGLALYGMRGEPETK